MTGSLYKTMENSTKVPGEVLHCLRWYNDDFNVFPRHPEFSILGKSKGNKKVCIHFGIVQKLCRDFHRTHNKKKEQAVGWSTVQSSHKMQVGEESVFPDHCGIGILMGAGGRAVGGRGGGGAWRGGGGGPRW